MPPDWKRRRAIRVSSARYRELREQAFEQTRGLCFCGCGRRAESTHHLVGGIGERDDVLENLVALNGDGTRGCHGALTSGHRTYTRLPSGTVSVHDPVLVRQGIRFWLAEFPEKLAYIIDRKGESWLDANYASASAATR